MTPSRKKGGGDGRKDRRGQGGRQDEAEQDPQESSRPDLATLPLEDVAPDTLQAPALPFPVVCVGASAGGLDAFTQLLEALPVDTGMAFVLVSHLSPSHASHLAEILARATGMPVQEVKDEPTVQPNRVYVIPPDTTMVISKGALKLLPRRQVRGQHHPIDQF